MLRICTKRFQIARKAISTRNMASVSHQTPRKFDGKVVVVTGGGQGIGRAICFNFANSGARVVIVERDNEAGKEVAAEITSTHGEKSAIFVETDVARDESIARMVEEVKKNYGQVDILINNAGIAKWCEITAADALATFDTILGVNLRGSYSVTKHILPLMTENQATGRSIINIASTRGLMSEPNSEAYAASKGGILAMTHALAVSLSKYKIRVNAISPGWIDVQNYRKKSLIEASPSQPLRPEDHAQHPAGRIGVPDDIAKACMFLSSADAEFMTGQNLVIDGGMTVKMIYLED